MRPGVRCSSANVPGASKRTSTIGPLGRREEHFVDERLVFVAATVAADELHPRAGEGDVEQPGVRGVREVEAHDLAGVGVELEVRLAAGEHDVAEAAHRDVGRARLVERGDAAVFDEDVVERDDEFAVHRRPVVVVGGFDDDVAVQAHVEAVVLADVRVVPVQAGVGEAQPVGELAADRDRRLGLVRHAVVGVVEPQAVPVDGRFGVAVVADVHDDFGSLPDPQRGAGDGAVVGEHADAVVAEVLGDGRDAQLEGVAVVERDDVGSGCVVEAGDVGREGGRSVVSGVSWFTMPPRCRAAAAAGRRGWAWV